MMLFVLFLQLALPPPDAMLGEGNARFAAGDYAGAYRQYHALLDAGQTSAAVYYNLGTTYVRLDSLARAVQYLEKARVLAPDDTRIAHNLAFVRTRLRLDTAQQPEPYWQAEWNAVRRAVAPFWVWWLGFAGVLAAATLAGWRLWYHPRSAWLRRGALASGGAGAVLLALAYSLSAGVGAAERAVVLEDVVVRDSTQTATTLRAGQVVMVRRRQGDRAAVALGGREDGWVPTALLGPI